MPIGWLYITYHLLGKPETTIEKTTESDPPTSQFHATSIWCHPGSSFTKKYLVEAMVPGVSIWHQPKQGTSKGTSLKTTIYLHQVWLLPNGLIQWSWWQSYFLLFVVWELLTEKKTSMIPKWYSCGFAIWIHLGWWTKTPQGSRV